MSPLQCAYDGMANLDLLPSHKGLLPSSLAKCKVTTDLLFSDSQNLYNSREAQLCFFIRISPTATNNIMKQKVLQSLYLSLLVSLLGLPPSFTSATTHHVNGLPVATDRAEYILNPEAATAAAGITRGVGGSNTASRSSVCSFSSRPQSPRCGISGM